MTSVFIYENAEGNIVKRNFNPVNANPRYLAKRFSLEEETISICFGGEVLEIENGHFVNCKGDVVQIPSGVEVEVYGDVFKAPAKSVKISNQEVTLLHREVSDVTKQMVDNLGGLASAPMAVGLLKILTILAACTKDPSLVNERTKLSKFKYLTFPRSFRSSLIEVINCITKAFMFADRGMEKIRVNMSDVPSLLAQSMEAFCRPDDSGVSKVLDSNKGRLSKVALLSADVSTEIATKFDHVLKVIYELQTAVEATQSHSEDEVDRLRQEKDEYESMKLKAEEDCKTLKNELEEQLKRAEEELANYKEQSANLGSLGKLAAACLFDVGFDAAKTVCSTLKDVSGGLSHTLKSIGNAIDNSQTTSHPFQQVTTNLHESYERAFATFLWMCTHQELDDPKDIDCETIRKTFSPFLKYNAVSSHGKDVETAAKKFLKRLDADLSEPEAFGKLKLAHAELKVAAEIATKIIHEDKMQKVSVAESLMECMTTSAAEARASYNSEKDRARELRDKESEARLELAKLGTKLSKINLDTLDMNEIVECLSEGLTLLSKFHQTIVNGPMMSNFEDFLSSVDDKTTSELIKKKLLCNAMKACGIVVQVSNCAMLYKDISKKYVIPQVSVVTNNLQLKKEDAKARLLCTERDFSDMEKEIHLFINEKKEELQNEYDEKIQLYTKPFQMSITD